MPRKCLRWVRGHPRSTAGLLLALLAVLVNGVAYAHARAMTHFSPGVVRTPPPEALSAMGKVGVLLGGVRIPKPSSDSAPDSMGLEFEAHRLPGESGQHLAGWYTRRGEA